MRAALPAFHEISPDQKRISKGQHWKTFVLYGFGAKSEKNCSRCPATAALLAGVPGLQSALFSTTTRAIAFRRIAASPRASFAPISG